MGTVSRTATATVLLLLMMMMYSLCNSKGSSSVRVLPHACADVLSLWQLDYTFAGGCSQVCMQNDVCLLPGRGPTAPKHNSLCSFCSFFLWLLLLLFCFVVFGVCGDAVQV